MGHWDAEPDVGGRFDGLSNWLDGDQLTAWASGVWEDGIPRVASGVPDRTHRLKALGNAVVPQIPELIGCAILRSMVTA
jgi:DNA (cytosine-5)-methyltransferase 1